MGFDTYESASSQNYAQSGRRLSKQTWAILGKIREVDDFLGNTTDARQTLRESHPEVMFAALNGGRPMTHTKKTADGFKATFREFVAFGASERISRILTKAQDALGVPPSPNFAEFTKTMEGIGLAREEAFALAGYQMIGWNYRMQLIPYADELPAIERTAFDVATRAFYGTPGVGRIFYDTFVKPKAHPDGVRYVENLLAQPG